MRTATAGKKSLELLNEEGKNLVEVKKVLLSHASNPILFNSISASLTSEMNPKEYSKKVLDALLDSKVDEKKFESIVLSVAKYSNKEALRKHFEDFRVKLSNILEKKGQKHFSTGLSLERGGVCVIKRIGINLDFIRREFLVTEKMAKQLQEKGFVEQYALLKVQAIVKHMIEVVEKACGKHETINMEISHFYYDDKTEFYNIDLIIHIPLGEAELQSVVSTSKHVESILEAIKKEYYRTFNG